MHRVRPWNRGDHAHRPVRMLTLIDEFTRECLAIDVARRMTSEDVLERLSHLLIQRGPPEYIRSDNGPEFTAHRVRDWLGLSSRTAVQSTRSHEDSHTPGLIEAHACRTHTAPVVRGKRIREKLLAGRVPDVPITVDANIPDDHDKTIRERFAVTKARACWKCHEKMSPPGCAQRHGR